MAVPCEHGSACPILAAARDQYQVSEQIFNHLTSHSHPHKSCRHGAQCFSHQRVVQGGSELKDLCHHAVYFHVRATSSAERAACLLANSHASQGGHSYGLSAFCWGERPVDVSAEPSTALDKMLAEVERNGYAYVMTMPGGGSLMDVVHQKRLHPRFLAMDRPDVTDAELLSLMLYTGTDIQGDVRKWLRTNQDEGEDSRWPVTVEVMRSATVSLCEEPPQVLYHGLNGVKVEACDLFQYLNLVSFSECAEVSIAFAKGIGGTVSSPTEIGSLLVLDTSGMTTKGFGNYLNGGHGWYFADMQWISKFSTEKEWLCVPGRLGKHSFWNLTLVPGSGSIQQVQVDVEFCM